MTFPEQKLGAVQLYSSHGDPFRAQKSFGESGSESLGLFFGPPVDFGVRVRHPCTFKNVFDLITCQDSGKGATEKAAAEKLAAEQKAAAEKFAAEEKAAAEKAAAEMARGADQSKKDSGVSLGNSCGVQLSLTDPCI